MKGSKKLFSPDNLSFGLVLGLAFFLPLFFLPIAGILLDVGKMFFVSVVTLLTLALWFAGRLIDGEVKFPRSMIVGGVFAVVLSFLISSLVSPTIRTSLFGQGFEVGTLSFILVSALLLLVASLVLDSRDKIFRVYVALLASFSLIAIFQIIRLFAGPSFLSFGVFTDNLSNTVGKWNDLGTFFGFMAVLALSTLEILQLSKLYKIFLYVILALSLFLLAVVNFTFGWIVLTVVSVIVFVYVIYLNKFDAISNGSDNHSSKMPRVPGVALVVFLISLFFSLTASGWGGGLATYFKTTQVEVRPSWSATYDIATASIKANPIFGAGPNRFGSQWSMYKPDVLNTTIFWSTDFNAGIGLIPTFVVTTGLFGLFAWLFFFGNFLYRGVRAVASFGTGRVSQYLIISSSLSALYLWLFTIFYVPNVAVTSLAFLMTGVFVAVLMSENMSRKFEFSLLGNPKLGFASVLVLISLIVASSAFGYLFVQKTVSVIDFQKAVTAMNSQGNINLAEEYVNKAVSLNPNDVYYRGLSQIAIARINNLLQEKDLAPDAARTQFTALMGNAIQNAQAAKDYDPTNYINWMNLGGIYETVVPLGVSGAYEEAKKSYEQALLVAPKNPLIYYTIARLEVSNKDTKAARVALNQALTLKNNYTEALFFLSQIEANEGNVQEAISKSDQASILAPNDVGLFFQLGLLKYTAKDYQGAISALERATSLTPDYANAMYFLGLSYDKTGRKDDAIKQFTRIQELNPDNQEVKDIIINLMAGKDAFANVPPPNNTPEKKKTPPIKETTSVPGEF